LAAGLALPFLTGSRRLLLVPLARALPLPALAAALAREGRWVTAGAVALCGAAIPAALALSLTPALLLPDPSRSRLAAALLRYWRWRGWIAALLAALLAAGVRASSGRDGLTVRLGPGALFLLGGVALLAAAATLLSQGAAGRRRGAAGPATPATRGNGEA